ncbi:uncharacterized protein LOC129133887 [Agelaius phoeniceus]|uniref:uncharacterized protein LOC129133887 n=1 Tax=Agelaius phoeniceus TaxID=39638 RepID=UPI004054ECEA
MYYQNKRQKVDHHLQGGIHNNNPRELTQVSDQSPRVDKPNNAKINKKNKPPDRRYENDQGKKTDRQSDGRRLQGWSTVSDISISRPDNIKEEIYWSASHSLNPLESSFKISSGRDANITPVGLNKWDT